jgi:hypothetical protein
MKFEPLQSQAHPMRPTLVLVSHALCPYVQRAAVVLAEKGVPFERRDIDLANKPDWFLKISPLGKTPVLRVDDEAIFESAVICEYLDETVLPRLHPADALCRARHRSWMEFGSALLNLIGVFYNAADEAALAARAADIRARLAQVEATLGEGPSASSTASPKCSAGGRRWRSGPRWPWPYARTTRRCYAASCKPAVRRCRGGLRWQTVDRNRL